MTSLQQIVSNCLLYNQKCALCGADFTTTTQHEMHLFIEVSVPILSTTLTYSLTLLCLQISSDRQEDDLLKVCDIPNNLSLNKQTYALHGCIVFNSGPLNIGNYKAAVKRNDGLWELYDSSTQKVAPLSAKKELVIHVLFYVKSELAIQPDISLNPDETIQSDLDIDLLEGADTEVIENIMHEMEKSPTKQAHSLAPNAEDPSTSPEISPPENISAVAQFTPTPHTHELTTAEHVLTTADIAAIPMTSTPSTVEKATEEANCSSSSISPIPITSAPSTVEKATEETDCSSSISKQENEADEPSAKRQKIEVNIN